MAKTLTVLGATGSIGLSTLDVVARHSEHYRVAALTANRDVRRLRELCARFHPSVVVMADETAASQLRTGLVEDGLSNIAVESGVASLEAAATLPEVDMVMAAIVGAAGLLPTLAAARAGKRVLLANKEALVMSGALFMDAVHNHDAELLPVDSEHNAIFQCLPYDFKRGLNEIGVRKILLTASGGPFRNMPREALTDVTPEQACAHPNWSMGRKISVDSATMMNKGLEVIEACWLFNTTTEKIQVVLHPQSVIHSMVEYVDGSILAQLGSPDMRTPIAHALAWPQRMAAGVAALDVFAVARLDFEPPDDQQFPCLRLAYHAAQAGGTASTVLNAANEVAVDAFLNRELPFLAISQIIEQTLERVPVQAADSLETILAADNQARRQAGINVTTLRGTV